MMNTLNTGITKIIAGSIILLATGIQLSAQNQETKFRIHVDRSLAPLAQGWIKEYKETNPDVYISLIEADIKSDSNQAEIKLFEHHAPLKHKTDTDVNILVGQVAILPIINENNTHFSRELRRGIRPGKIKEIFFAEEFDWLDKNNNDEEPEYALYSPMPNSSVAEAFATFFDKQSVDLKGIYVSGEQNHLLTILSQDSDAISYSKASLVFDPATRQPIVGIKVLPIDLNNNGRLDRNEQIFDNLDLIIQHLEEPGNASIPSIQISLSTPAENLSNSQIEHFLNWVKREGQLVNIQLGYNSNGNLQPDAFYTELE